MNNIKSFIYLDDYKMYSISSQIFEGMTEYIIRSSSEKNTEKNEQKGPVASGRLLADIIEKGKDELEKRFLHDYSYTLFENELIKNNKVISIDKNNLNDNLEHLSNFNFIKITGRIAFNDTKLIDETISKFNDLGVAITYVTQNQEIQDKNTELKKANGIKDRNEKSKVEKVLKNKLPNVKEMARSNNLYMDPEYLSSLQFLFKYGYNNQFEVQMPFATVDNNYLFSAILDRNKLKEEEINLIKKYARLSEKEFTIFGTLTQIKSTKEDLPLYKDRNETGAPNMKELVMNLIFHFTNIESAFTGKLDYEYVIDPIAIYRDI